MDPGSVQDKTLRVNGGMQSMTTGETSHISGVVGHLVTGQDWVQSDSSSNLSFPVYSACWRAGGEMGYSFHRVLTHCLLTPKLSE